MPAKPARPRIDEATTDATRTLIWELFSASSHLEDIRRAWAQFLNISGPQWLIMMAIETLDTGDGVPVGEVSSKLHVNSTFITAQSKQLESIGYIKRTASKLDARVVLLSLTDRAIKTIAAFSDQREQVNEFIFGILSPKELQDTVETLTLIRGRMEKALRMIGFD